MEPLAISVSEAVRVLGLGRTSIYALISAGRLETFKLGRRTLVKTSSIRRLVDPQAEGPACQPGA
jgi:excisionase family DNA binding protein